MGNKKKKLYSCRDSRYDGCPEDVEIENSQCDSCRQHWADMVEYGEVGKISEYNKWLEENGYTVLTVEAG